MTLQIYKFQFIYAITRYYQCKNNNLTTKKVILHLQSDIVISSR